MTHESRDDGPPRHGLPITILLHLVPGVLITAVGGTASYLMRDLRIPAYFYLELAVLVVMVPVMTGLLIRARRSEGAAKPGNLLMRPQRAVKLWEYIVYPLVILAWAGGTFTLLGDPINGFFRELVAPNLPTWADIGHMFTNPEAYDRGWRIITWVLGIPMVVLIGPAMEEIYFRGYLLPRIPGSPAAVIAAGVILFALYHVFTIWMVPLRIIALIPLVLIVWKTRSVMIGIISHCALNLIGDTLGSIPVVFG